MTRASTHKKAGELRFDVKLASFEVLVSNVTLQQKAFNYRTFYLGDARQ
jgi:hypothetical protein